jgi:hypothetical protein
MSLHDQRVVESLRPDHHGTCSGVLSYLCTCYERGNNAQLDAQSKVLGDVVSSAMGDLQVVLLEVALLRKGPIVKGSAADRALDTITKSISKASAKLEAAGATTPMVVFPSRRSA